MISRFKRLRNRLVLRTHICPLTVRTAFASLGQVTVGCSGGLILWDHDKTESAFMKVLELARSRQGWGRKIRGQ
eukprot:5845087-Amphidinium_carterae.1